MTAKTNTHSRILRLLVLLLSALGLLLPEHVRSQEPSKELDHFVANVQLHTLPNGLRVVFYRRGIAPVFAGTVSVGVGGSDEQIGRTGISHILEHMAFKGTETIGTTDYGKEKRLLDELEQLARKSDGATRFTPEQKRRWEELRAELNLLWEGAGEAFSREYEKRGAYGLNATTSSELTQYFVNMPVAALEFWCWAESERLLEPVMRQFYEERDVVLEERRMRFENNPGSRLYELLLGTAFLQHPYRFPVIGYQFDISRITAGELEAFRRKYYVPANIVVAIVGDIVPDKALPIVNRYFGRLAEAPPPPRPRISEPPQEGERRIVLKAHAEREVDIAYRKPAYPHPDDPPLTVMAQILAGSRLSPLYTELVKRRKLATGVDELEAPGNRYPNLLIFSGVIRSPHSNEEFIAAYDQVIEEFKRRRPSEESLRIAKRAIAMDYLRMLQADMSLALQLASAELLYDDWRSIIDWYRQAMSVTAADVQRVANQYLVPTSRTIGLLEPKDDASR